jgi:hypothetical protein
MAWSRNHYTFYAVNPVQEKGDESKKTVSVAYYVEVLAGSRSPRSEFGAG